MSSEEKSASGGSMRRLGAPGDRDPGEAPVDLTVLLEHGDPPPGREWRHVGSGPYFSPGDELRWYYHRGVDMCRVIRDDDRGLVAWLPSGTARLASVRADGRGMRDMPVAERMRGERVLMEDTWRGEGVLRIAPTGKPWSIWYFWPDRPEDGGGWYVNFELPHQRPADGARETYTRDLVLDQWFTRDEVWLKDYDEVDAAEEAGRFTPAQAHVVRALPEQAWAELIAGWSWPLDEDWEWWRPPAEWDVPIPLPDDVRP